MFVCTSETFPNLHAVPLHQRAAAGPPAQKPRPPSGGNHPRHLQHGLGWLRCLLLGFHARVPEQLPRCGHQPTSCAGTQLQAWTGENLFYWSCALGYIGGTEAGGGKMLLIVVNTANWLYLFCLFSPGFAFIHSKRSETSEWSSLLQTV